MKQHLSPRTLAEAIGVSESSVKRWVDSGRIGTSLTAGGHRRIPRVEAVRFIRQSGSALARPEILGLAVGAEVTSEPSDRLYRLLSEGRQAETIALVQWIYISGSDLARVVDGPVQQAMDRLGKLWRERTDQGIFIEHRATQICIRALHELATLVPQPGDDAPLALGGAPRDDPYILPTLCAATVLAEAGLRTDNLGPDMPLDGFVAAIEERRPALVWLSVTSPRAAKDLRTWIERLHTAIDTAGALLVIGGRESRSVSADPARSIYRGSSMAELAAFAHGFAEREGSR